MASGKGFPRSLELSGGINIDQEVVNSPAGLTVGAYRKLVVSGGSAGIEIVDLPGSAGAIAGQRVLVDFLGEGDASDVVRINAAGSDTIETAGFAGDTPVAVTNVDLDTPGENALFEFDGTSVWHLLYTSGATS